MSPEEILDERNKTSEAKKKLMEYPLTPDECFKGINLKNILKTYNWKEPISDVEYDIAWKSGIFTEERILGAMKEACDQTVDLCAENATCEIDNDLIQKQSILKTKDQIK